MKKKVSYKGHTITMFEDGFHQEFAIIDGDESKLYICLLIALLKKENETNSPEEKEFNLKWIEALKESIDKSVNKNKED